MDVESSKNTSFSDIITMMREQGKENDAWAVSRDAKKLSEHKKHVVLSTVGKDWKTGIRSRMESNLDLQVKQALDGVDKRWTERKKKQKRIKNIQIMKFNALRRAQADDKGHQEGRGFKYIGANYDPAKIHKRLGIMAFDASKCITGGLSSFNPSMAADYHSGNMRGRLDPSLIDTGSQMMNFINFAKHGNNLKPLLPGMNLTSHAGAGVNLPNYGTNRRCFQMYSKTGLTNVLNSRVKKGKLSSVGNGLYVDKRGIVISKHGPFWPTGYGPVCQCSEFVHVCPEREKFGPIPEPAPAEKFKENPPTNYVNSNATDTHWRSRNNDRKQRIEPLLHHNSNQKVSNHSNHLLSNNLSNNRHHLNNDNGSKPTWRGKPVIYDSERSSRTALPHAVPEGMSESLVFESRFESGNLRQVRRIGELDYELVLRTDLYTKRHTQWFYFRIQKAQREVTYKFTIINLLKKDSLYNYGMKPIVYSELLAKDEGLGWHRMGENICYAPWNNPTRNGLLSVDLQYHSLEFELTFDWEGVENDSIYVAHCYPYTYTDLKTHIDGVMNDQSRAQHVKREVLCETTAGNACFLLTITEFPDKEKDKYKDFHEEKKGIVLTARVHPGETQASWMMKGAIDFLTSDEQAARELRKRFIFKVVPMLNPDGVIVGNYRTSLTARDLNRNYRHPRQAAFPTVWHTKQMVEHFSKDHEILLYCDLHGHSRKPLVFMYGCERNAMYKGDQAIERSQRDRAKDFVEERLFPWLMFKTTPQRFSFHSSKYGVRRCKEATGRVVMFRQMRIHNSFTMEASFSGTVNKEGNFGRHFNISDFESVGRSLCESVLEYDRVINDPVLKGRCVLDITKDIAKHMMANQKLMANNAAILNKSNLNGEMQGVERNEKVLDSNKLVQNKPAMKSIIASKSTNINGVIQPSNKAKNYANKVAAEVKNIPGSPNIPVNGSTTDNESLETKSMDDLVDEQTEMQAEDEVDDSCYRLLEQLHLHEMKIESDTSSDSDSESEPEMSSDAPSMNRQKKKKRRKKRPNYMKSISAPSGVLRKTNQLKEDLSKPKVTHPAYVNRYANRSNGGIPIYAQERVQERAARRLAELRVREEDKIRRREMFRKQLMMGDVDLDSSDLLSDREETFNSKPVAGEIYGIRYQLGQQPAKYTLPPRIDPLASLLNNDDNELTCNNDILAPLNSQRDNEVLHRLSNYSPERNNMYKTAEVSFCNLTFKPSRKEPRRISPISRASTASTLTSSDGGLHSTSNNKNRDGTTDSGRQRHLTRPATQGTHRRYQDDQTADPLPLPAAVIPKPHSTNGLVFSIHKVKVTDAKTAQPEVNLTNKSNGLIRMKPLSATVIKRRSKTITFDDSEYSAI